MRHLERRLAKLEERETRRSVVLLWQGQRPADALMIEPFGSTDAPAHLNVMLLRWADDAPDEMLPAP